MRGNLDCSICDSCTWSMLLGSYWVRSLGLGWLAFFCAGGAALPEPNCPAPARNPAPYSHWRRFIYIFSWCSLPKLQCRRGNIERPLLPADGTVPDAPAECRYINFIVIQRIGNHTMSHLEIEALDSRPMASSVGRPPGRRLKASGVQDVGISRIYRHVVNMPVLIECYLPALATIL